MGERFLALFVDPPTTPARTPVFARVIGLLFVLGGLLGLASLALPHPGGGDAEALLFLDVVCIGTGVAFVVAARHVPSWLPHPTIAAASLTICLATYWSGRASGVYATTLFWVALFCGYFFSRLAAMIQIGFLLAAYGVVLSQIPDPNGYSPATRWLLSALALVVTTNVTSWLSSGRRAAEERSQRFFDLSTDMLCTADADGFFVEVNPAWTAILGYSEAELLARPFVDFVHPDDRERTAAEAARIFEGHETEHFDNRYLAKDGSWRWMRWSASLSPDQGLIYARATDVTESKEMELAREELVRELGSQARTDPLTSLPNRRWLPDELARLITRARRQDFDLCLAVIDLDHFKAFNDRNGHQAGDELLCEAADRWRATLRTSDFLARYGGDEFIALLPDCDPREAEAVIERLCAATPAGLTSSAGIATWNGEEQPAALIARADAALYEAKAGRRDAVAR
ncbi:MAG TPA: diguanylate cyclase [Thermoleophilaceae bacterium]|jgi:diguanylate cyclase (GGDEF)-like protein/PAS domain S-box-containing protein